MATVDQFKGTHTPTYLNPLPGQLFRRFNSWAHQHGIVVGSMNGRTRVSKTPLLLRRVQSTHCSVDIAVRMREVLAMPWELPWVVSNSFPEAAILLDKSNRGSEDEIGVVLASARRRF